MPIKDMNMEQLQARKAEIRGLIATATEEEINGFNTELDQIEAREAAIKEAAEKRRSIVQRVAGGAGIEVGTFQGAEQHQQTPDEIRNSQEYIDAFEKYVRTGSDAECRALLSTNVNGGTVAVPDFVYEIVKTAWENNKIMSLVRKVEVKGNMKVNFEISATGAVKHTEGGDAVSEENLQLGIVTLIPAMYKKWIGISREVYSLRGEAFLRYIYDELAYHIVKLIADDLIAAIAALPQTATATTPAAAKVTAAPELGAIAEAIGNLSDDATNPVIILNKSTWAAFKAAQYQANFAADPFEGLDVYYSNQLPAYSTAATGAVYGIVGDFDRGALANMPNGNEVDFIFDEYSQKKQDMIEVLGEQYAAAAPVASGAFALLAKPA